MRHFLEGPVAPRLLDVQASGLRCFACSGLGVEVKSLAF